MQAVADKTARDADDYRQLFRLKAWQAGQSAPDHGDNAFEKWQYTAVRNLLRSCKRELGRHPDLARYDLLDDEDRHAPSFEKSMELRDLLARLRSQVDVGEWHLLLDYVAHGCNASSVWKAYGCQGCRSSFRKRISDLRARCQRLIAEMC